MKKHLCPQCLTSVPNQREKCALCGLKLVSELQKMELLVVGLGGSGQKKFYPSQLIQGLTHGSLLDEGYDARVLSYKNPLFCIYKKGVFGKMAPIHLVSFCEFSQDSPPQIWRKLGAYVYCLEDKKDEKGLETLLFDYYEGVPLWRRYWRTTPCVINMPAEGRLLSVNIGVDPCGDEEDHADLLDMRRCFGARWGRRLLVLLEKVFPWVRFDSFDVTSPNSLDQDRVWDSFIWILRKKGILKQDRKVSYLSVWTLGLFQEGCRLWTHVLRKISPRKLK